MNHPYPFYRQGNGDSEKGNDLPKMHKKPHTQNFNASAPNPHPLSPPRQLLFTFQSSAFLFFFWSIKKFIYNVMLHIHYVCHIPKDILPIFLYHVIGCIMDKSSEA